MSPRHLDLSLRLLRRCIRCKMRMLRRDALRQPWLRFITVAARFGHSPAIRRAVRKPSLFENNLKPMVISGGDPPRRRRHLRDQPLVYIEAAAAIPDRRDGRFQLSIIARPLLNDSSPSIVGCWLLFRHPVRPLTYIRNTKADLHFICVEVRRNLSRGIFIMIN